MAATTFLPANPRLPERRLLGGKNGLVSKSKRVVIQAKQGEGKSVDENMIVLRMRIKKMKVVESISGEAAAPAEWSEWEKRVFPHYHEGVLDTVGMLQAYLMNTRPSVALGVAALVAMAVPLSTSVAAGNLIKVARGLLAGCHVCIDIDF